jgi:hypothetical protein
METSLNGRDRRDRAIGIGRKPVTPGGRRAQSPQDTSVGAVPRVLARKARHAP